MPTVQNSPILRRRAFLGGALALSGTVALAGCASYGQPYSLTEAVRRLLVLSSERAFVRMTAPGGFWDEQVAQLGLGGMIGRRGDVLSRILSSAMFKQRLEGAVADIAVDASYRAAPLVADTVRTIGFANTYDLIRGGPTAATAFLRGEMGGQLLGVLVPEVDQALRIAEDPLMRELIAGMTGVDPGGLARSLGNQIEGVIWDQIAQEEAAIRANPSATGDPMLRAIFGAEALL